MPQITRQKIQTGQIRAQIDNQVNEEDRTVELIFSTGSKGLRNGWDGQYYEELSMDSGSVDMSRLQNGAPLLAAHNSEDLNSVIGVVENARIENGTGSAKVRFAKDPESDKIFQKIKDKILRNVSIGYNVRKYLNVSGKEDKIPTYRAVDWTPMEISIVPIGFDSKAQVRKNENEILTEVEIETRTQENDEVIMPQGIKPVETPVNLDEVKKAAIAEERNRQTEIRSAVRSAKFEEAYADELINKGLNGDQARKLILEKLAEKQSEPIRQEIRVEIGTSDVDKKREAIVEAVLSKVDKQNFKPVQGNQFNNMSLMRMLEVFHPNRFSMTDAQFATRAMSSSDLPYILANVAEKSAQAKYNLQPKTWSRWASTDTLKNYKTHDKVRSGDFSSLLERKENGEFKRGSFGEEREQVTLKDWGIIMPFTRRMLINDDLGEISKVTSQAGVSASRLENRLVYEILTSNPTMGDSIALFYATHANLGTGAAISDTTIGEAFQLMREQTSVDGLDKLNLSPKYLICGPSNEVIARKYLAQITPDQATNVNVFSGSLELIVDSEITTNDYFFAADSSLIPTVTLFHLEGEESPRVESRINFETESVEIKCAHAAVAAASDFRGLVKNANAS